MRGRDRRAARHARRRSGSRHRRTQVRAHDEALDDRAYRSVIENPTRRVRSRRQEGPFVYLRPKLRASSMRSERSHAGHIFTSIQDDRAAIARDSTRRSDEAIDCRLSRRRVASSHPHVLSARRGAAFVATLDVTPRSIRDRAPSGAESRVLGCLPLASRTRSLTDPVFATSSIRACALARSRSRRYLRETSPPRCRVQPMRQADRAIVSSMKASRTTEGDEPRST